MTPSFDPRPVGVFDTGLGGLCAVRELRALLPGEDVVYFGDTARVPYGNRSPEIITRYALQIMRFMASKDIKAVLVACGTISSVALGALREAYPGLPVFGVAEPSCEAAAEAAALSGNPEIVVLGTAATVGSGIFQRRLASLSPDLSVVGRACPLFVPLVENGHISEDDPIAREAAEHYLAPLREARFGTAILGCTHYPMLAPIISRALPGARLIDSGYCGARALARELGERGLASGKESGGSLEVCVSDETHDFKRLASGFLGFDVSGNIYKTNIEMY